MWKLCKLAVGLAGSSRLDGSGTEQDLEYHALTFCYLKNLRLQRSGIKLQSLENDAFRLFHTICML